jgi:hypothetical protein
MSLINKNNVFSNGTTADGPQVNANFDTIYNDYNGNITDSNIAASGITTYGKVNGSALSSLAGISPSAGQIPVLNLINVMYPIGAVYITTIATDPATVFGTGTWIAFGAGKVLVGYAAGDSDFGTAGATGGEKTVTLDTTMIPSHTHDAYVGDQYSAGGNFGSSIGGTGNTATTRATGGGLAHNNLQPYLVVYMFKRIA